ncbi:TatD family hydrolase [Methanolobus sp. ZRKC3]|uniref:TatD family hydrolase n=1 Tax=Methanolobus sp. ZRKC3 TaxID=3125786 RepID=UPI0032490A5A
MKYQVIDSHCHLDFPKFNKDQAEVIESARKAGVIEMINSGVDYKTNTTTLELSRKYDHVHATLGLNPHMAPDSDEEQIKQILNQIERNIDRIVGIGEAGLDHYYCKSEAGREKQIEVFKQVIDIADNYDKPLVIHGREAEDIALQLTSHLDTVVFHCYGGSIETMQNIVDAGYFVSVPTLVCFSEHHKSIAKQLPLENMLIETDSPYLSPRKGRNEPAFVLDSVPEIASLKGIDESEVAQSTLQNTRRAFGL